MLPCHEVTKLQHSLYTKPASCHLDFWPPKLLAKSISSWVLPTWSVSGTLLQRWKANTGCFHLDQSYCDLFFFFFGQKCALISLKCKPRTGGTGSKGVHELASLNPHQQSAQSIHSPARCGESSSCSTSSPKPTSSLRAASLASVQCRLPHWPQHAPPWRCVMLSGLLEATCYLEMLCFAHLFLGFLVLPICKQVFWMSPLSKIIHCKYLLPARDLSSDEQFFILLKVNLLIFSSGLLFRKSVPTLSYKDILLHFL